MEFKTFRTKDVAKMLLLKFSWKSQLEIAFIALGYIDELFLTHLSLSVLFFFDPFCASVSPTHYHGCAK